VNRPSFAAAAALFFAATGCLSAQEQPPPSQIAPAVTVTRAAEREIVERAIVTGTLIPRDEILVSAELDGLRITDVLVEEGDEVAKGQVLARLSRDLLEAQLAQNEASIARSQAAISQTESNIIQAEAARVEAAQALDRARTLLRSGNTTEVIIEQRTSAARSAEGRLAAAHDALRMAQAELRSAEAQRQELKVRLARTEIRAPEAGIVSRKSARVGATAMSSGDPLFRIIARGEIELEGEVTETQLVRIREGAAAQVIVDRNRTVEGRVRNVSPEVDRLSRLGRVRIWLPRDPALRIGTFARGNVELARHVGVAVPASAVLYDAAGATIQVVVDGKVQVRRVNTGLSADGFVQIAEGVAAGEAVVTRAGSFLRDGDLVRPALAETAQAEGMR
jgi:RND family efflux transporter MFP subunit